MFVMELCCRRYFMLLLIFMVLNMDQRLASGSGLELWLNELKFIKSRPLISIWEHMTGRNYLRGFTRGILGNMLFPIRQSSQDSLTKPGSQTTQNSTLPVYTFASGLIKAAYKSGVSASKNYEQFQDYVINSFCQDDEQQPWGCCDHPLVDASCSNIPKQTHYLMDILGDPINGMPLTYLLYWCVQAWNEFSKNSTKSSELGLQLKEMCPDPCFGKPCRMLQGTANPLACSKDGIFQGEYHCECDEKHDWDETTQICVPRNPCIEQTFPKCIAANTIKCLAISYSEVVCVCKQEYMGADCSLPRDACVERFNKSQENGNTNCQVGYGNRCIPILGTDHYSCNCTRGYIPSLSIGEDNCFDRRDPCENQTLSEYVTPEEGELQAPHSRIYPTMTCANGGHCISSTDLSRAACLCRSPLGEDLIFEGLNCENSHGMWETWSKFSHCIPETCGHTRYKWRRRLCSQNVRTNASLREKIIPDCRGTSEEVRPCEPMGRCHSVRLKSSLRGELLNYDSVYMFLFITVVQIVMSVVTYTLATSYKQVLVRLKL